MEPRHTRFRRLIEPLHDGALAFARGLTRSRADGDDLFQESLLRALDKLDALRDDAAFRRWLYRILITVHRNRCRRAFWRRLLPLTDHDEPAAPDPDLAATDRARAALATLPAEQRETIVLFELEGWLVDEIAAVHAISVSAVKSRLSRGRDRLRVYYTKHFAMHPASPASAQEALLHGETP